METTHAPVVQASAYRLICLLESTYPEILNHQSPEYNATQNLLSRYIRHKTDKYINFLSLGEIATAQKDPSISSVVQVIDIIDEWDEIKFSRSDKEIFFSELQWLANYHHSNPEIWNNEHAQWSINSHYNSHQKVIESKMTPPADALNLVCRAMIDKSRFLSEKDKEDSDLMLRLESFYLHWLEIGKEHRKGQQRKCSAGIQHDLLFLLLPGYLTKDKVNSDAQPFHWISDLTSFYMTEMQSFIVDNIKNVVVDEQRRNKIFLEWSFWSENLTNDESPCPIIKYLPPGWKKNAHESLLNSCPHIGINPLSQKIKIQELIDTIECLPIPYDKINITPLIADLFKMKSVHFHFDSNQSSLDPAPSLKIARNSALERFQTGWRSSPLRNINKIVTKVHSSIVFVDKLMQFLELNKIKSISENRHSNKKTALEMRVELYYLSIKESADINELNMADPELKRVMDLFFNDPNSTFVVNFFHSPKETGAAQLLKIKLAKLKTIKTRNQIIHPLILTDEKIDFLASVNIPDSAVYMSPYVVNLLFIHGLLTPPSTWSQRYTQGMRLILDWMLIDNSGGEDESIKATFKSCYSKPLLLNFLLYLAIHDSILYQELINDIWHRLEWDFSSTTYQIDLINSADKGWRLLSENHIFFDKMTEIWELIKPIHTKYSTDINTDPADLVRLFRNDLKTYPTWLREEIWINTIINARQEIYIDTMIGLLSLDFKLFSHKNRNAILALAQEGNLKLRPLHSSSILRVLQLPANKISFQFRSYFVSTLLINMKSMDLSSFELLNLFALNEVQLTTQQRIDILASFFLNFNQLSYVSIDHILEISCDLLFKALTRQYKSGDLVLFKMLNSEAALTAILEKFPETLYSDLIKVTNEIANQPPEWITFKSKFDKAILSNFQRKNPDNLRQKHLFFNNPVQKATNNLNKILLTERFTYDGKTQAWSLNPSSKFDEISVCKIIKRPTANDSRVLIALNEPIPVSYLSATKSEYSFNNEIISREKICVRKTCNEKTSQEIAIISNCAHPNIVAFLSKSPVNVANTNVNQSESFLFTEFIDGLNLNNLLIHWKADGLRTAEYMGLYYFVQIGLAVAYLHNNNILHRNLNLQSITLSQFPIVKLTSFEFSRQCSMSEKYCVDDTASGTPHYMAPEITNKSPYNQSADVWSLGVILYELLTFNKPFQGKDTAEIFSNIQTANPYYNRKGINSEMEIILSQLLNKDPKKRPSVEDILRMPFFIDILKSYRADVLKSISQVQTTQIDKNLFSILDQQINSILSAPVPPSDKINKRSKLNDNDFDSDFDFESDYYSDDNGRAFWPRKKKL